MRCGCGGVDHLLAGLRWLVQAQVAAEVAAEVLDQLDRAGVAGPPQVVNRRDLVCFAGGLRWERHVSGRRRAGPSDDVGRNAFTSLASFSTVSTTAAGASTALLHLVGRRHAVVVAAAWRQIAKASSSNATATRRIIGTSTANFTAAPPRRRAPRARGRR